MNINIRPVRVEDAAFINEMRIMDGVRENILSVFSERVSSTQAFLSGISEDEHILAAEIEENSVKKVVGLIGLHINKYARLRHSGSIGIMVHADYQGKGIGRALMTKILDLADNWLMLKRVELDVIIDNERAINLYREFGFETEGTKKYAVVKDGKYVDVYLMARYKL